MSCGSVELCRVATSDGLLLDGALHRPVSPRATRLPVDACLVVHGTGSNFYAPGVLETFARRCAAAGLAALRINTRGHDGICSIPSSGRAVRGGATFECIAECALDLAAWIDFLAERGFGKIALAGHSMGGVKSIYALAHDPRPEVACVVGISPPRFCHEWFMTHPGADVFRKDYSLAAQCVAEGRPDELLDVKQPLPFLVTAGGFLAKYGPHDDYDVLKHLPILRRPALIILGTQTIVSSPAFDGLPNALEELIGRHPHLDLTIRLVENADINYRHDPEAPFRLVAEWWGHDFR